MRGDQQATDYYAKGQGPEPCEDCGKPRWFNRATGAYAPCDACAADRRAERIRHAPDRSGMPGGAETFGR